MGGGLESRCLGRVYGADGVVRVACMFTLGQYVHYVRFLNKQ